MDVTPLALHGMICVGVPVLGVNYVDGRSKKFSLHTLIRVEW